eukprot:1143625-Pelagomonas_calceolata.AAC.4
MSGACQQCQAEIREHATVSAHSTKSAVSPSPSCLPAIPAEARAPLPAASMTRKLTRWSSPVSSHCQLGERGLGSCPAA